MRRQPPKRIHPVLAELKELREARGLSREKLQDVAGYSHSTIQRFERGFCDAQFTTVANIAQALGKRLVLVDEGDAPLAS